MFSCWGSKKNTTVPGHDHNQIDLQEPTSICWQTDWFGLGYFSGLSQHIWAAWDPSQWKLPVQVCMFKGMLTSPPPPSHHLMARPFIQVYFNSHRKWAWSLNTWWSADFNWSWWRQDASIVKQWLQRSNEPGPGWKIRFSLRRIL